MRTLLIAFGIIQLWITLKQSYNEADAIEFKMTNLICESYNESWFTFNTCRLRAISRNKTCMFMNGTFVRPAYNVQARVELFKKANGYKPWLVNTSIDICRFLKKPFNPAIILIFKLFKNFSNFNHTCPYTDYAIIDGFYLRWMTLPHTMPTGEYLLSFTWFFDGRPQFITKIYFIFKEDLMTNH